MNVVDLKNIVLLVTKKIWSSVNLERKIMSQVRKIMFKQIVQTKCCSIGGFLTLHSNMDATYKQSLCSNDFSAVYPARYFVLFQENIQDTA